MPSYRITTDTYSGKPFRWDMTVLVDGLTVPAYCSKDKLKWLHPSRVERELLRELNPNESGTHGSRDA